MKGVPGSGLREGGEAVAAQSGVLGQEPRVGVSPGEAVRAAGGIGQGGPEGGASQHGGVQRALRARGVPPPVRQSVVAVGAVTLVAIGYLLLPESGDLVDAPAALVYDFRVRSLGLLVMLYATLGAVFGMLTERAERVPRRVHVPA